MIRLVAPLVALLLLAPPLAAQDARFTLDAARWGTSASPREATGGDRGVPLSVLVHNVGTSDYNSASARLLPSDGLAVTVPGGDAASLTAPFAAGSVWEATFRVDLDDALGAGDLVRARVELTVWRAGTSHEATLATDVRVPGRTEVGVAPADPLLPGAASVDAGVRLVNDGDGPAGPILLVLAPAPGSGLLLAGDDAWTTPPLGPSEAATVDVALRTPAARGAHALVATLDYVDAAGAARRETRTLAFQVAAPERGPLAVELRTDAIVAGRNGTLVFVLRNTGDAPIERLRVEAAPKGTPAPFALSAGATLLAPARLAPGATAEARLPVLVARDADDLAGIALEAAYVAGGVERADAFALAVPVAQGVDLRLLALDVTDAGDVSGIVVNAGTGTAYNPRATVGGATAVLSQDLSSNDPVSFRVPGADARAGRVEVAFDWNDDRGGVHAATVAGDARAVGGSEERALPALPWAAVAAALVGLALARRRS